MAKWPAKRQDFPSWWHPAGTKVRIVKVSYPLSIFLKSALASLTILKAIGVPGNYWYLDWDITGSTNAVKGRVVVTGEQLLTLFKRKGSAVIQGVGVREKSCLNVPCPGTGNDGDPNISILVSARAEQVIRRFVLHGLHSKPRKSIKPIR